MYRYIKFTFGKMEGEDVQKNKSIKALFVCVFYFGHKLGSHPYRTFILYI
jgi:hypothetical protein